MAKADRLLPNFLHFQTHIKYTDECNIEVQLENVTDHDWAEVVRCSVCKKVVLEDRGNGKTAFWCPVNRNYRCWDEFCNRGERREPND